MGVTPGYKYGEVGGVCLLVGGDCWGRGYNLITIKPVASMMK